MRNSNRTSTLGWPQGFLSEMIFDPWPLHHISSHDSLDIFFLVGKSPKSRHEIYIKHLRELFIRGLKGTWSQNSPPAFMNPSQVFPDISDAAVQTSLNTKESFLRSISSLECSVLWKVSLSTEYKWTTSEFAIQDRYDGPFSSLQGSC